MALPAVGATVAVALTGTVLKMSDAGPSPKVLVQVDVPGDDTGGVKQVVWVTDTQVT